MNCIIKHFTRINFLKKNMVFVIMKIVRLVGINMICEKCWADAHMRSVNNPEKTQSDHYIDLLQERKSKPCQPEKLD